MQSEKLTILAIELVWYLLECLLGMEAAYKGVNISYCFFNFFVLRLALWLKVLLYAER